MIRRIVGIDPGPKTSGLVVYELSGPWPGKVVRSYKAATLDQVRMEIDEAARMGSNFNWCEVVVECTQAGPPSTAVVKTTEVVGRIMERCDLRKIDCEPYYRREVLQALDCAKKGNKDGYVRAACIELHGGEKSVAVGTKKAPGPLYGVSSHGWQALGVVCTHIFNQHYPPGGTR